MHVQSNTHTILDKKDRLTSKDEENGENVEGDVEEDGNEEEMEETEMPCIVEIKTYNKQASQ